MGIRGVGCRGIRWVLLKGVLRNPDSSRLLEACGPPIRSGRASAASAQKQKGPSNPREHAGRRLGNGDQF